MQDASCTPPPCEASADITVQHMPDADDTIARFKKPFAGSGDGDGVELKLAGIVFGGLMGGVGPPTAPKKEMVT